MIEHLDDEEIAILRYLADEFRKGDTQTDPHDWPRHSVLAAHQLRDKFLGFGWVVWEEGISREFFGKEAHYKILTITPRTADAIHQLDNPPPFDYLDWLTRWFRCQWWSIPIVAICVVPPWVLGWIEVINKVFGILSSWR